LISGSSPIFSRPKVKQRQTRDIIGLRRFASEMSDVVDEIAYDLARGRAPVPRQELLQSLIRVLRLVWVHGLRYPIGVKQQGFAGVENHPA
jgi:hypothetical protein